MSEERKVNLVFAAENQTKGTLNEIKQDVAGTAAGIEQSGKKAAKGIEGLGEAVKKAGKDSADGLKKVGDGFKGAGEQSKQAEDQVSQAARSMIQSIQRTTAAAEAGEKGTSKYFEALAKQRGIGGDVLEPYIAQLRAAEVAQAAAAGSMGKMGMSAKATASAMNGVGAQLSDIFVSIQGGMPLMTVATQQGLQLRDMFGGFGAAGKAVGTTLLGMVNPFTVAGAAAVALGVAYYQGSQEAGVLRLALVTTGNAAGTSVTQLSQFAAEMGKVSGVESQASAALADFVAAGVRGSDMLKEYAQTAIDWEKATGTSVDKTAKAFAKLQDEPLKAALELQKGMNFLTVATYEEIRALDEQGRKTDAAAVAQKAYSAALRSGAAEIRDNLGTLERTWDKLGKTASTVWSLMLGAGRSATLADKIGGLQQEIATAERQIAAGKGFSETAGGAATGRGGRLTTKDIELLQQRLALNKQNLAAMEQEAKQEQAAAERKAAENGQIAAREEWNKKGLKYLSDAKKLERELAEERQLGIDAGYSQEVIETRLKAIREDAAKKDKSGAKAAKELTKERESEAQVYAQLAGLSSTYYKDLESGQKRLASGKISQDQYIKYVEDLIKKQPFAIALAKEEEQARKDLQKAIEDDLKQADRVADKRQAGIKSVEDALQKARQEEEAHALAITANITLAEAMERLTIARLEDHLALARAGAESQTTIDALERELRARRELQGVLQQKGVREAGAKAAKEVEKVFDRTAETVGRTLSDFIMAGGDDAASYLKRLFATLVLQPIVQYGVNSVMGALGVGQQGSAVQSVLGGNNVGSTVLNNAGAIGAGYQAMFGASAGASSASLFGANAVGLMGGDALGTLAAANGMWAGVAAGAQASAQAAIAANVALEAGTAVALEAGTLGTAIGTGATGAAAGVSSMMSGVMAAAPYLAAAVALYAIIAGMDDSGTPHSGAGAVYSKATGVQSGAEIYNQGTFGMGHRDEYSADMQAGISGIAQGLGQTLDSFAVSFGKTAGYSVATAFADDSSKDGSWGSLKIADELGKVLVNWEDSRASKWAPREFADGEDGYKEYLNAVAVDVKAAFLTMDLPAWANQALKAATDIDTLTAALQQIATVKSVLDGLGKTMSMFADLSGDLQTRLLAASGGVEALGSNAGAFYESFYTEGERALKQRELQMAALAGMGLYIDPAEGDAAKAIFKKTVLDAMASDQVELAAKLMAMSGNFGQMADYAQKVLDEMAETAKAAAEVATKATQEFAQGVATQMASAYSAMNSAGDLLDKINGAQGGPGNGYGLLREQRLWASMAEADYKQQIELAGELTDMVLGRHQIEQANAQKLLDFGRSLRGYVDGLKIGALSPLTMGEKLAEAAKQYAATLAKAQAGDETAMSALQGASTSYLDLARQYFASGDDYTKIFNSVTGSLDALGLSSQTEAQLQLDVSSQSLAQLRQLQGIVEGAYAQAESEFDVEKDLLQRQVDELLRTANGIEAVRDLLGGMPAELATLLNGGAATGTGSFATLAQSYVSLLGGAGGSSTDARYVAQAMGHMDSANWKAELNNAMGLLTDPGARAQMQAIFDAVAKMKGIDGSHADGLGYVPFDNYIAQLHMGERVLTAEENRAYTPTWSSYGRGGGVEALVTEIKALRTEVSQLRKENREDSQIVARATVESNMAAAGDVVNGVGQATVRAAYAETVQPKGYK